MISDPIGLASGLSIRPFRNHLFELAGGRRHGRRISDAIQADKTQKSGNEKQDCSKVFSKPKKVCTALRSLPAASRHVLSCIS